MRLLRIQLPEHDFFLYVQRTFSHELLGGRESAGLEGCVILTRT